MKILKHGTAKPRMTKNEGTRNNSEVTADYRYGDCSAVPFVCHGLNFIYCSDGWVNISCLRQDYLMALVNLGFSSSGFSLLIEILEIQYLIKQTGSKGLVLRAERKIMVGRSFTFHLTLPHFANFVIGIWLFFKKKKWDIIPFLLYE